MTSRSTLSFIVLMLAFRYFTVSFDKMEAHRHILVGPVRDILVELVLSGGMPCINTSFSPWMSEAKSNKTQDNQIAALITTFKLYAEGVVHIKVDVGMTSGPVASIGNVNTQKDLTRKYLRHDDYKMNNHDDIPTNCRRE